MKQSQLHSKSPRGNHGRASVNFGRSKTWGVALSVAATVGGAWACSGVGPIGTNIVIYDEVHHMEHFIRNASFRSRADNFGFIAPTPSRPDLNKASNRAFYTLAALAPVMRFGGGFGGGARAMAKASAPQVQVIQEADVAGYHATTLRCPDAHAINDWMNAHGYVSTPEVEKWAERYCSRGWYLTAFKVIDKSKFAASTGTVRMSFRTDKPYNPFYVPTSNIPINGGGTLRVYFVSTGDYEARIGHGETWQVPQWTAQIPEASAALLCKQVELPFDAVPDNSQVETFVDNNFPRPAADDIYFMKRQIPTVLRKATEPPIRKLSVPTAMSVLGCVGLLAVVRRRRAVG